MGYKIGWYVPGKVIYFRWSGPLTWELLQEANREITRYLNEGTPLVHLISDLLGVTSFPMNVTRAKEMVTVLRHPSLGWTVTVTGNAILRFTASIVSQVVRHTRTTAVASVEEAFKYLAERDDSVDWSQADEAIVEQGSNAG